MIQEKLKTIQFDHLSSWQFQLLYGIGFVCIVVGIGFIIVDRTNNALLLIGHLFIFLAVSRPYFFKRYVGWNKKGIQLKFGRFKMDSISFNTIQEVVVDGDILFIFLLDGKVHEYDVADISSEDILRLQNLIVRFAQEPQNITTA